MRRTLGALSLLVLLPLTACGAEDSASPAAEDTAPSSAESSTPEPMTATPEPDTSEPAAPDSPLDSSLPAPTGEASMVSETAAGGSVSTRPVRLDDGAAVRDFAAQFERPALGAEIAEVASTTEVPPGQALVAAVVAIGCDVPPGVSVSGSGTSLKIIADKVAQPMKNCFAPVTTVAVLAVDQALL